MATRVRAQRLKEGRRGGQSSSVCFLARLLSDVVLRKPSMTIRDRTPMLILSRGFSCAFQYGQTCVSYVNNFATATVGTCSNGQTVNVRDLTVPYYATGTMSSSAVVTDIGQFQVVGPLIDIRWRPSDTTSTSSSAGSPGGSGASSSPIGNSNDSGLSTGAKAGIGIGVALGVLAVLVGAFFLWRRSRKTKVERLPAVDPDDRHEVQGTPVYEMDNQRHYEEAASKNPPWYERHEVRGSEPQIAQLPT